MKKLIIGMIITFFLTVTTLTCIGMAKSSHSGQKEENTSYAGALYGSTKPATTKEDTGNYSSLYKTSRDDSGPSGPGNRPGSGSGIGQEMPIKDDLSVLVACCVLLGIGKMIHGKWGKKA